MILAIDPGLASVGWAVVARDARVVEFGVLTTEHDKAIRKSTDRARRAHQIAHDLGGLASTYECDTIAAESMLLFGNVNAATSQVLIWGVIATLAQVLDLELVEVVAKDWQHEVTPGTKKITYANIEKAIRKLVGPRLDGVEKKLQTHAIDAIGVGVYTALRPVARVA